MVYAHHSCILHTLVLYLDLATVRADLQAAPHDPSPLQAAATHSRGEGPARGQLLARLRASPATSTRSERPLRCPQACRNHVLSQKVDQGRRPRRLRSTRRAGVVRESRRALCWHRPPVLYPRGATRAKLCKCCQGQTPQNFDRVLAAACLYRDMLDLNLVQ